VHHLTIIVAAGMTISPTIIINGHVNLTRFFVDKKRQQSLDLAVVFLASLSANELLAAHVYQNVVFPIERCMLRDHL